MDVNKILEKLEESQTNSETLLRFLANSDEFDVVIEQMSISEKIILRDRKMNKYEIINIFEKYRSSKHDTEPEIWIQVLGKTPANTKESFRVYDRRL